MMGVEVRYVSDRTKRIRMMNEKRIGRRDKWGAERLVRRSVRDDVCNVSTGKNKRIKGAYEEDCAQIINASKFLPECWLVKACWAGGKSLGHAEEDTKSGCNG